MAARLPFIALLLASATGLVALLARALGEGGWTAVKLLLLLAFLPVAIWLGICVGNAVSGFAVLVGARRAARAVLPVQGEIEHGAITLRTALAVTVRNEDLHAVLPPLGRLIAALDDPASKAGTRRTRK